VLQDRLAKSYQQTAKKRMLTNFVRVGMTVGRTRDFRKSRFNNREVPSLHPLVPKTLKGTPQAFFQKEKKEKEEQKGVVRSKREKT